MDTPSEGFGGGHNSGGWGAGSGVGAAASVLTGTSAIRGSSTCRGAGGTGIVRGSSATVGSSGVRGASSVRGLRSGKRGGTSSNIGAAAMKIFAASAASSRGSVTVSRGIRGGGRRGGAGGCVASKSRGRGRGFVKASSIYMVDSDGDTGTAEASTGNSVHSSYV